MTAQPVVARVHAQALHAPPDQLGLGRLLAALQLLQLPNLSTKFLHCGKRDRVTLHERTHQGRWTAAGG